ncbi:MAG: Na+-dependent transporter [Proteobacteria bacterium]|nr:Na+-dependent transporter [Pseudomonadota bacterium]
MDPAVLLQGAIVLSIALLVFSIGLEVVPGTITGFLKDPRPATRALLAMFVAMPLFVLGLALAVPIRPAVLAALLALSISPMPPILPIKERKAGAGLDYALGIQVTATFLSLAIAPLWILVLERIAGRAFPFRPVAMLVTLLMTVVAPLVLGIVVNRLLPDLARKLEKPVSRVALVALLAGAPVLLWKLGPAMGATLGGGTLAIMVLVAVFGLVVGYLLGGPDRGNRGALALATSARHPGVAIGLATALFAGAAMPVIGAVLVYFLVSAVIGMPFVRLVQKQTTSPA